MPRLTGNIGFGQAQEALFRGNPGSSMIVCVCLVKTLRDIDPYFTMNEADAAWEVLLSIDTVELYEGKLWGFYKFVCGEDIEKTAAIVTRGCPKFIYAQALSEAIDQVSITGRHNLDIDDIVRKIQTGVRGYKQIVSPFPVAKQRPGSSGDPPTDPT
jgi:hypothetical protein